MSDQSFRWSDYAEVAHQLDAARREAAAATRVNAQSADTARSRGEALRGRLSVQATRLLNLARRIGAGTPALDPAAAQLYAARLIVTGDPVTVLAALRQADAMLDAADAALARTHRRRLLEALRNLAVYGPAAVIAVLLQIGGVMLGDERTRDFYAVTYGFVAGGLCYGLAWALLGVIHPHRRRTPRIGALVCFAPVLLTGFLLAATWR